MFTTRKISRMVSQLELDSSEQSKVTKYRPAESVQGRVITLCLTTWYFGYVFTQMSPIGPQVGFYAFGQTMAEEKGVGPCFGMVPFGAAVGVVIAYFLMNKLSRRSYLILLNVLNLAITGTLQAGNVVVLFICRFLQGVLVGNFMTLVPTYISQITPKQLSSRYGVYPQVSVVLGVLVAFGVGVIMYVSFNFFDITNYTPKNMQIFWRVMLGIPLLPSIFQLFFIAIGYIPQSPNSYIIKNKRQQARQILCIFYEEQYVQQMLEEREAAIFNKESTSGEEIQWTSKGVFIGFMLSIFQVLTGIASFVTQAGHVMSVSINQPTIGLYTPVLITISQLVGTFISVSMLKYIQWKTLTIIGGFTLAFLDALIAVLFYLKCQHINQQYSMILSCICIMAFMFTFGVTLGSSVWPYISFMMPQKSVTAALVVNWMLAGISIVSFSENTNFYLCGGGVEQSPFIMLFIYAGATFILSILCSVYMIDIKGLSVRRVQVKLQ